MMVRPLASGVGIVERVMARGRDLPGQLAIIENRRGRWVPITAGELAARVQGLAAGLGTHGIGPGRRVGIVMSSQSDWVVADLAIQAVGAVSVAVPLTNDDEELAEYVRAAAVDVVVVDDVVAAQRIDGLVAADRIDPVSPIIQRGRNEGDVLGIDDLVAGGRDSPAGPAPDDVATVTFTAGAGGAPRPVEQTVAELESRAVEVAAARQLVPDDVAVVVLHPSHPFERTVTIFPALLSGAVLAFAESEAAIDRAILEVQPTFAHLPAESVRAASAAVRARLHRNRGVKRVVARWWERSAHDAARDGGTPSRAAVAVVGTPALRSLGWGRMRSILVTCAAVPGEDSATLAALGSTVTSGYALVEAGGLVGVGHAGRFHTVGTTSVTCPGDVLVVAAAGREPIDTGDRGRLDGADFVVDGPVATLTETGGGSTVLTADVERELRESPYIALARVHNPAGELEALIEVDAVAVGDWATTRKLLFTTFATLVELDEVRHLLADEVARRAPLVARHVLLGRPLAAPQEITRTRTVVHGRADQRIRESINNRGNAS